MIEATSLEIKQALENGVSKYPATEGRFPAISGIRFEFDPNRPPGNRINTKTLLINLHKWEPYRKHRVVTVP